MSTVNKQSNTIKCLECAAEYDHRAWCSLASAHGSALEKALKHMEECEEILAENPDWKPAQERVNDAEKRVRMEMENSIKELKRRLVPNDGTQRGRDAGATNATETRTRPSLK